MSSDAPETGHDEADCSTTESFADHDIEDGSALIERTYYRLTDADRTAFEPTAAFYNALESAFMWAYLGTVEETGIPPHVEAAIDDARAFTEEDFAEDPEADLRMDVIPTFYQYAAGFHCAYRP